MNRLAIIGWMFATSLVVMSVAGQAAAVVQAAERSSLIQLIEAHCLDCHDRTSRKGNLALDEILSDAIERHPRAWEAVVRKLASRQMPPSGSPLPSEASYREALTWLTTRLDATAQEHPTPGRTDSLRRLTRTEYGNAIRDLLALEVDVHQLLPADESSRGFDNITVGDLSPTLLNRYVTAAQKISRLAVGRPDPRIGSDTFRQRADVTQDHQRVEGLPLGTRGGMLIPYYFPQAGEYEVQVWLMRDRNDELEGLQGTHELQVLIDRRHQATFTITRPPRGESDRAVDANLKARFAVPAGQHNLGVTFAAKSFSLLETERQPLHVHYNFYRHPRLGPAVYQVSITGPFPGATSGDTPSRRRIFLSRPATSEDEDRCAREILLALLRRAYRRPVNDGDLETVWKFFQEGRTAAGFEAGIERALAAILVNPQFLFRIERDPSADSAPVSAMELASRLSFFLWSSLPDDELLDLAEKQELQRPEVLERQVRRMLADPRANSLVTNFADQWLYLRNLETVVPDGRLFPDFDHNLREAFRRETELLFAEMMRRDLPVLTLLDSPATWLNERLAQHYGIPHVSGSHFRRVPLDTDSHRGGILRHGSILTVTSYATRTSPVLRGKWILENVVGEPPPPPPPNVPALQEQTVSASLPVRERLAAHRANVACASCHDLIDPVGFGLENFDALGRWRDFELEQPVDATGSLPGTSRFQGVQGLEQALLQRPELFVQALTEKLLTFALGRGIDHHDAPAVRKIVRHAAQNQYRWSSLVVGVTHSVPFQMRSPVQR